MKTPKNT